MGVVIRLQRAGGRNHPAYRVVAADSRDGRDGRFLEKLGHYDPLKDPVEFVLKADRIRHWVSKGARLSDTVAQLLKRHETQASKNAS